MWGLKLWAPVVNLLRDPRWGRNEEGYSEDPPLTGAIATAYGKGLSRATTPSPAGGADAQALPGQQQRGTGAASTPPSCRRGCKHEYDEAGVQAGASQPDAATGVMASYNLVNGRPNTVSPLT